MTEVTTILTALALLSGAAAPAMHDYLEDARHIRATHDVRTLSVTLVRLFDDTAGDRSAEADWRTYDVLVGDGAIPLARDLEAAGWAAPLGERVGLLDDHLVTNAAGYGAGGSGRAGWRGAYLQARIAADPWGHRYAVNIESMRSARLDTVVLSAGPDGVAETLFRTDGLPTRGDDIVALIASGGRPRRSTVNGH